VKGGLTGFIEAIICYPTEFVKTQLQLQSKANPATWIRWMGMEWIGLEWWKHHKLIKIYTDISSAS